MEVFRTAVALIVRSMVLSAQSASQQRLLFLQRAVAAGDEAGELARPRDENRRLTSANRLLKSRFDDLPYRKLRQPIRVSFPATTRADAPPEMRVRVDQAAQAVSQAYVTGAEVSIVY